MSTQKICVDKPMVAFKPIIALTEHALQAYKIWHQVCGWLQTLLINTKQTSLFTLGTRETKA